jgi:hypothetical protein
VTTVAPAGRQSESPGKRAVDAEAPFKENRAAADTDDSAAISDQESPPRTV